MAKLVTLLEQHLDRQLPTVVIQATTWWETVFAHVKLQENGLGVPLLVNVCRVFSRNVVWGGSWGCALASVRGWRLGESKLPSVLGRCADPPLSLPPGRGERLNCLPPGRGREVEWGEVGWGVGVCVSVCSWAAAGRVQTGAGAGALRGPPS